MYPKSLQVPNTRAFILRIRGVLLCLSQNLGEGQLHVLVHCLQQEVSVPQVKARQREGCQEETMYDLPSAIGASEPLRTLPGSGQAHTQKHCLVEEPHQD